jgi:predicted transposase YbfD/YdcC
VISLRGNHPALLEDISLYFEHFSGELPHLCDQGEGSRQEREAELSSADRTVLAAAANRMGRSASCRHGNCNDQQKNDETTTDTRYFLSSVTDVERFAYAVRKHWAIENRLHWCLDIIFDEDASRARKKDMFGRIICVSIIRQMTTIV